MEHSSVNYDIVYNNYARQIKSMKVGHIGCTGVSYRRLLTEFIVENNIKTATASSTGILRMFINWLVAI